MSTPATSVLFGFDFQTNAAIVLMLENIREMSTVRVEGLEDIEIQLSDGSYVLAQAKSVVNSSSDFRNVRAKAKAAMASLSDEATKVKVKELVYITNSPNPFNDEVSKPMFYGHAHVKYESLPPLTKDIVSNYLSQIENPLDTSQLKVQVLPFETDDERQRYKVVQDVISDFIGDLDIEAYGLKKKLHEVWQMMLDKNGTKSNRDIKLTKKAIVWPIIVYVTGKGELKREAQLCNLLDDSEFEEISRKYGEVIDYYIDRYDFATKVVADFFSSGIKGKDAIVDFANSHWENYKNDLNTEGMEEDLRCNLIKIILFSILSKKVDINKIKLAVNL